MIKTALGRLRLVAHAEGISLLLLLFIAMPLKYLAGLPEVNFYVGITHGILFVFYVLLLIQNTLEKNWGFKQFALGFVASIVPFGTFYADKKIFNPPAEV